MGWIGVAVGVSACASAPAPEPPPPAPPPVPAAAVWTAAADVVVAGDEGSAGIIPRAFTRVEAIRGDSLGVVVRCNLCAPVVEGLVPDSLVVYRPLPPEVAAWGTLAEFALSVREAARLHDLDALRPVMSPEFSYSFVGIQSPEVAFDVWRSEDFATLDRLPGVLDRGLSLLDGRIWVAPPEFLEEVGYRGLRAGFRQTAEGRWEWLFLIGGIVQ